eukprot:352000-Chlamydomonas_euryale.AAC.1
MRAPLGGTFHGADATGVKCVSHPGKPHTSRAFSSFRGWFSSTYPLRPRFPEPSCSTCWPAPGRHGPMARPVPTSSRYRSGSCIRPCMYACMQASGHACMHASIRPCMHERVG